MSAYIYFALKRKHYGVIIFHVELAAGRMLTHALRVAFWLCQFFFFCKWNNFIGKWNALQVLTNVWKFLGMERRFWAKWQMTNTTRSPYLSLHSSFVVVLRKFYSSFFSLEKQFKHCKSISHRRLTDTCAHFFWPFFLFSNSFSFVGCSQNTYKQQKNKAINQNKEYKWWRKQYSRILQRMREIQVQSDFENKNHFGNSFDKRASAPSRARIRSNDAYILCANYWCRIHFIWTYFTLVASQLLCVLALAHSCSRSFATIARAVTVWNVVSFHFGVCMSLNVCINIYSICFFFAWILRCSFPHKRNICLFLACAH